MSVDVNNTVRLKDFVICLYTFFPYLIYRSQASVFRKKTNIS